MSESQHNSASLRSDAHRVSARGVDAREPRASADSGGRASSARGPHGPGVPGGRGPHGPGVPGGRGPRGPRGPHGPGAIQTEKPKNGRKTFIRLISLLKPQLPKLVLVFLFVLISTLFDILCPMQLGNATTVVFNGAAAAHSGTGAGMDFDALIKILSILLILYVGYAVFGYLQQFLMARVTQNLIYSLRQQTEEKLNKLPLSFYDKHSKGDVLSRVVNDIDLISSTLQDSMMQFISTVITLIGICIMMFSISWVMTLIVFVSLPISAFVAFYIASHTQRFYLAQQTTLGQLDAHIEENYSGQTEIKAFVLEKQTTSKFEDINNRYFQHAWKAQFVSGIVMPITMFVSNLVYVAVCAVGGYLAINGVIAVGDIQAFIQYAKNFGRPISQLASVVNVIQGALAASERVFEILDAPQLEDESEKEPFAKSVRGDVKFDHVCFSYEKGKPVIKDFSVDVVAGQTVAIVGPSGAGKTTLVNLLMRFYETDSGNIFIDGTNIKDMSRNDLRKHFGMVLQDTWLFKGSIRDNIAYGLHEVVSQDQIEAVAKAAYADHFIRALPDGYNTIINEEASNISAGQRQLLAIARALLSNPEVLILDEATSSIDTRTEHFVQRAMTKLAASRTSFVIAHRLSTIKEADLILVINEGDIVEFGTHVELLERQGFYAQLYNSQFSDCIDEVFDE